MAEPWVRLWAGMTTDPKWQTISRKSGQPRHLVIAIFTHLMILANEAKPRGCVSGMVVEDIASALDCDENQIDAVVEAMQGRVIVDGSLSGWKARQPERIDAKGPDAKPGAQRQREYRQRNAERKSEDVTQSDACNENVTQRDAPEAEAEVGTEAEAEKQTPANAPIPEVQASTKRKAAGAANRFDAAGFLIEHGVEPQTAADYLTLRKAKRAPATRTAMQDIIREAGKTTWSAQEVITKCCQAGWSGFKAAWIADQQARAGPRLTRDEERKRTLDELTGRTKHGKPQQQNERDITAEVIRIA